MKTLGMKSNEYNENEQLDGDIKELQFLLSEVKNSIETKNKSIRTIEQISAGRRIVPYNMNNPMQKWDFECSYNENGSISVRALQYKYDAEVGEFCGKNEATLREEGFIVISTKEKFLEDLGSIFDAVERTGQVAERIPAGAKGKELFSHIKNLQQEIKEDGYRYFTLEDGLGIKTYLRESNNYANLGLNEVQLSRLANHVKADNNHEDILSTKMKEGIPLLLKKSTLSRYLNVFASTPKENIVPFIQGLINENIIVKENAQKLEKEAVKRNKGNNGEIYFYEALIKPYLTDEKKALCDGLGYQYSLDLINERPKKFDYINTAEEKKFADSFIRESFEELKALPVFKDKTDPLGFFQAAVIDYNMSVDRFWLPEESNALYIPQSEEYYKNYDELSIVETSNLESSSIETKVDISDPTEYLLKNGLHGQFEKGAVAKIAKDNYNFMKRTSMKEKVQKKSSTGRFDYVVSQFNQAQKLSPMMKKLCPYIPMQETGYHNDRVSGDDASGLRQFIPTTGKDYDLYPDDIDKRTDIILATKASIESLRKNYIEAENNPHLQQIFNSEEYSKYFSTDAKKDLLITLFAINIHNCGPGHIKRVLEIMTGNSDKYNRPDDKEVFESYMEKHEHLGPFIFMSDHYSKHPRDYQGGFGNYKYLIQAPQYVYNILKYFQLDSES